MKLKKLHLYRREALLSLNRETSFLNKSSFQEGDVKFCMRLHISDTEK